MQNHVPSISGGSVRCERCGEFRWDHRLAADVCPHPANLAVDHSDNPSRYRCGLCGTPFVDRGSGYEPARAA